MALRAPEWVAAIRADPPLKVLASIHEAFESLRLWFERAIRPATDSANPLFMKVIQGGYSSGLKVLCSRLAIELNVRNTGELRAWCQIAQGFMRAIGAQFPRESWHCGNQTSTFSLKQCDSIAIYALGELPRLTK